MFQLLLLTPLTVKAYGLEGHLTVLNIALNQLSTTQQDKIKPLLSRILNQLEDSGEPLNPVISASWLDDMHSIGVLSKIHYSGRIIYNPQNIKLPENAHDVLFYKQDLYWALEEAISAFEKYNKNPKYNLLSQFQQSMLLMYLVHLVGDAHQPLHVIEPIYKPYIGTKNPYGKTYGANSIKINTYKSGECLGTANLHTLWDGMGCLTDQVRKQYPPRKASAQQYFINAQKFFAKNFLEDYSKNIVKNTTLDPKKYLMDFDAKTWINDINSFQGIAFSTIDNSIINLKNKHEKIVLDSNYIKNVQQATINLIFLAGLRLGHILNKIFPDQ